MPEDHKRKKKSYYLKSKKSKNEYEIGVGMRGFLITCNNNEAKTVVEAYKVLNEYADKLYAPSVAHDKEEDCISEEEDIEAELKKHVEGFKNLPVQERRFQNVNTKVRSVVFIKTTLSDPLKVVQQLFDDTLESGLARSRFILRLVPVVGTCKAEEEKLSELCEEQLKAYLQEHACSDEVTYSTLYKIRCNNVLNKDIIYACVNKALKALKPQAKVDCNNPDIVINVNVLPKVCCLSILRDYNKYKKYNLNELLKPAIQPTNPNDQPTNSCTQKALETEPIQEALETEPIQEALETEPIQGKLNAESESRSHEITCDVDDKQDSNRELVHSVEDNVTEKADGSNKSGVEVKRVDVLKEGESSLST